MDTVGLDLFHAPLACCDAPMDRSDKLRRLVCRHLTFCSANASEWHIGERECVMTTKRCGQKVSISLDTHFIDLRSCIDANSTCFAKIYRSLGHGFNPRGYEACRNFGTSHRGASETHRIFWRPKTPLTHLSAH